MPKIFLEAFLCLQCDAWATFSGIFVCSLDACHWCLLLWSQCPCYLNTNGSKWFKVFSCYLMNIPFFAFSAVICNSCDVNCMFVLVYIKKKKWHHPPEPIKSYWVCFIVFCTFQAACMFHKFLNPALITFAFPKLTALFLPCVDRKWNTLAPATTGALFHLAPKL